jgi:hypothetical protein
MALTSRSRACAERTLRLMSSCAPESGAPSADSGIDTIDYSSAGAALYATANGGPATTLATFSAIEDAIGTTFGDVLIGNGRLTGEDVDWVFGGAGAHTFVHRAVETTRDSRSRQDRSFRHRRQSDNPPSRRDSIADMTIQVVHPSGTVMNAADFVL